jgi:hypothetical protein
MAGSRGGLFDNLNIVPYSRMHAAQRRRAHSARYATRQASTRYGDHFARFGKRRMLLLYVHGMLLHACKLHAR